MGDFEWDNLVRMEDDTEWMMDALVSHGLIEVRQKINRDSSNLSLERVSAERNIVSQFSLLYCDGLEGRT